jgi:hypothetical protein
MAFELDMPAALKVGPVKLNEARASHFDLYRTPPFQRAGGNVWNRRMLLKKSVLK